MKESGAVEPPEKRRKEDEPELPKQPAAAALGEVSLPQQPAFGKLPAAAASTSAGRAAFCQAQGCWTSSESGN